MAPSTHSLSLRLASRPGGAAALDAAMREPLVRALAVLAARCRSELAPWFDETLHVLLANWTRVPLPVAAELMESLAIVCPAAFRVRE